MLELGDGEQFGERMLFQDIEFIGEREWRVKFFSVMWANVNLE